MNGAGKTTTLDILTGQLWATSGHAYINGHDIHKQRATLGICPQYDYLPEYLTVRESLVLFAHLRGVRETMVTRVVDEFVFMFRLGECKHKLVQTLSGGTKRKLSASLAFIGNPGIVILDEPTSGMDPAARHYLWNMIKRARDNGATILLTTHRYNTHNILIQTQSSFFAHYSDRSNGYRSRYVSKRLIQIRSFRVFLISLLSF